MALISTKIPKLTKIVKKVKNATSKSVENNY